MTPMEQSERKGLVARMRVRAVYYSDPGNNDSHVGTAGDFREAADLIEHLSADARPAPMAEEVEAALSRLRDGHSQIYGPVRAGHRADVVTAHIDDLTRKVAEAEADWSAMEEARDFYKNEAAGWCVRAKAAEATLSRPQETDAVLAEREACATICDNLRKLGLVKPRDLPADPVAALTLMAGWLQEAAERIRSRPSPSPATETERKDEAASWTDVTVWAEEAGVKLRAEPEQGFMSLTFESPFGLNTASIAWHRWARIRALEPPPLLASVRPKEEGV